MKKIGILSTILLLVLGLSVFAYVDYGEGSKQQYGSQGTYLGGAQGNFKGYYVLGSGMTALTGDAIFSLKKTTTVAPKTILPIITLSINKEPFTNLVPGKDKFTAGDSIDCMRYFPDSTKPCTVTLYDTDATSKTLRVTVKSPSETRTAILTVGKTLSQPFDKLDIKLVSVGTPATISTAQQKTTTTSVNIGKIKVPTGLVLPSKNVCVQANNKYTRDIPIGTALNDPKAFNIEVRDTAVPGLKEGQNFYENIVFTKTAQVLDPMTATKLLNMTTDKYQDNTLIRFGQGSMGYYYNFYEKSFSSTTKDNPTPIEFLGQKLVIVGATKDSITLDDGKTYRSGDAYITQDKNNPLWVWDFKGLDTTKPSIGVVLGQSLTSTSLSMPNYPYSHPPYTGHGLCLPNNYACVVLDGVDGCSYTAKVSVGM